MPLDAQTVARNAAEMQSRFTNSDYAGMTPDQLYAAIESEIDSTELDPQARALLKRILPLIVGMVKVAYEERRFYDFD